jgi:hypothetical protein
MFGPGRRVARRTARRTARRQMYFQDAMSGGYAEPAYAEPAAPVAPTAPQEPEYLVELEKLGELKAAGVIDVDEFEAKKKQLLGI